MLSPWFDRSAPQLHMSRSDQPAGADIPPQTLMVLAPPRAGSFHWCRLLWQLGYGKPTEYFNRNPLYRSVLSRWGELSRWQRLLLRWQDEGLGIQQRWLDRLVQERWAASALTGTPFFSFKLQPFQLAGSFEQIWPRLQRQLHAAGCQCEGKANVVLLLRRNWRAAVASLHLSRCTGAYDLGMTPTFQHLPLAALLDPEALTGTAALYYRHLHWLMQATAVAHPMVLHHEDLVADQPRTLWRLLRHCDPALADTLEFPIPGTDWMGSLSVSIGGDPSPWGMERRQWLERIDAVLDELCDHGALALDHDRVLLQWLMSAAGDPAQES